MKKKYGLFEVGNSVMERPDDGNVPRWHGKIVGFADIQTNDMPSADKLLVVQLTNGGYLQNGVYISLMLVHPSNAQKL